MSDARDSQVSCGAAGAGETPPHGIYDYPADEAASFFAFRRALGIVVIGVFVVVPFGMLVIGIIIVSFSGPERTVAFIVAAALAATAVGVIFRSHRRRVRARVDGLVDQAVDGGLRGAFGTVGFQEDAHLLLFDWTGARRFATALLAHDYAGCTIRMGLTKRMRPVTPLTVPIEPTPLNERDPGLRALLSAEDDAPSAGDGASSSSAAKTAEPSPGRPFLRTLRRAGGWMLVFWGILVIRAAVESWRRGAPTLELLFWTAMLGIISLGGFVDLRLARPWLAVNGGLVHRSRRGLRLYARGQSVLFVSAASNGFDDGSTVTVADKDGAAAIHVTPDELHFLLRAWTSPLPPPPIERMSDFAP